MIDGAIPNMALPTITRDLRAGHRAGFDSFNLSALAVTISLLLFASLGVNQFNQRSRLASLLRALLGRGIGG
jgi:hypothetical protein